MVINKDFKEFIELLNAKSVKRVEDLFQVKISAGRPQNLADAAQLSKLKDKR
jgi:hypothetical protein